MVDISIYTTVISTTESNMICRVILSANMSQQHCKCSCKCTPLMFTFHLIHCIRMELTMYLVQCCLAIRDSFQNCIRCGNY